MFTNRSGRKGVTLAELLIASSIFFIISAVMTAALQQTKQIYTQGPVSYTHLDVYKRQGWHNTTSVVVAIPS